MNELGEWSGAGARDTAMCDGIELGVEHREVARFMRAYYMQHGNPDNARGWARGAGAQVRHAGRAALSLTGCS